MRRKGIKFTGRGDYIISSDMYSFSNAGVREARILTDHRMELAVLQMEGAPRNRRYVGMRTRCTLAPPKVKPQTEIEVAFTTLKGEGENRREHPGYHKQHVSWKIGGQQFRGRGKQEQEK